MEIQLINKRIKPMNYNNENNTNFNINPNNYYDKNEPTPLVFDIETYPLFKEYDDDSNNAKYWVIDCDKKKYTLDDENIKPGTHEYYKQCWYNHSSLSPTFSRILCISMCGVVDGKFFKKTFSFSNEFKIIAYFFNFFYNKKPNLIIGHNILNFDIPFITRRAISLGFSNVNIPKQINTFRLKPWELHHIVDTCMLYKSNSSYSPSLDILCYELGIPSPKGGGIKGSEIREFISNGGDLQVVVDYCERDVVATYEVFKRYFIANPEFLEMKKRESISKTKNTKSKNNVMV